MNLCVSVCLRVSARVRVHLCKCLCMYVCMHVRVRACVCVCLFMHVYVLHACVLVHTLMFMLYSSSPKKNSFSHVCARFLSLELIFIPKGLLELAVASRHGFLNVRLSLALFVRVF